MLKRFVTLRLKHCVSTYVTKLIRNNCQLSMLGLPGLCITHPLDAGRALVWPSFLAEVQCSMTTVVQPSTKPRMFICAWCRAGPTKPCLAQMALCRYISSVLYQVFGMSASGTKGTGPVLLLVGSLGLPWLIGSGLDVSKVSPHCPEAMVVWAQHKWMSLICIWCCMWQVSPCGAEGCSSAAASLGAGLSCSYLHASWVFAETSRFPSLTSPSLSCHRYPSTWGLQPGCKLKS